MPAGVSAYIPLANLTLSSAATSVTFASISQIYGSLVIVRSGADTGNADHLIRINGDTGANYSAVLAEANGSASNGAVQSNLTYLPTIWNYYFGSNTVNMTFLSIEDYSAVDKHKSIIMRQDNSANGVQLLAGRWASLSAVTSVTLYNSSNQFAAGSTFALYGVSA